MSLVLSRLTVWLITFFSGALLGYLLTHLLGAQDGLGPWLALACAALATAALVVFDARRAERLMEWLRAPRKTRAPRASGVWSEVAYRFERRAHSLERDVNIERLRREQFLAAIQVSPNGVLLLDNADLIEWCNSVAALHFGLDPERDRLQRVTNLLRAPAFVSYLQAGNFDEPVVFPGPLGQSTLSVAVRPYGEGQKLVLSQDITERERSEAMRRDFVANVSHEIRTPLTVVAGFVETMTDLPLAPAEQRRVLDLMQQQTARMMSLVGDLLTLAQLEGSPMPPTDRWIPLPALLHRAYRDAMALSATKHEVVLAAAALVDVAGSENEIYSAVTNLLNNAVRYTPVGGRIELSAALRDDHSLLISVADSGIGIAPEHMGRLTERFYRVDGSRSRDTGGTGLGLSIVKHVIQRHGGEVVIESTPGKGSRFGLVLPPMRLRPMAPGGTGGAAHVNGTVDGLMNMPIG